MRATKYELTRSTLMPSSETRELIFDIVARAGLLARALVYCLVAGLLATAAFAPGGQDEGYSPSDTFQSLETQPFGQIMLSLIAAGLFAYALWRGLQAALDTSDKGNDLMGILARIGMVMSGMSYLLVGVGAVLVLQGQNEGSGGGMTEQFASWTLAHPFGTYALMGFGLIVLGIGGAQFWRGATRQWISGFDLPGSPGISCRAIDLAIAGRGVLIGLIGVFLIWAGYSGDSSDAKGMASLLGWLREQPFGLWLYLGSALIIAGYGYYSIFQTRYLTIDID